MAHAQADEAVEAADSSGAGEAAAGTTALEDAVLEELQAIGIDGVTIDKLSSGQLAGILLTLTATDRQDKEEAVTTIAADAGYQPQGIDAGTVAGSESLRRTVEAALVRAGWSTDVSQITDAQVAALYTELSQTGDLDPRRIEDIVPQ
ncbi:hypothetical protein [Rhodovulum sp. 12E13]|uniref:hypothetical protein n=1 Tax=Rhodovulum sp. 12E13 TaxID=2203891 RepID=UPI0011C04F52|nr:hypothetical protein [Rhodovulum sp. 12E13]